MPGSPARMMHEYMDVHSPERLPSLKPRVLKFGLSPESDHTSCRPSGYMQPKPMALSPRKQPTCSPPYRKVRALRLFDTPTTPKTIIQKSSLNKQSAATTANAKHTEENAMLSGMRPGRLSATSSSASSTSSNTSHDRPTALHVHNKALDTVYSAANVNPFSPNSLAMRKKKRSRMDSQRENGSVHLERETPAARLDFHTAPSHSRKDSIAASRRSVASLFSSHLDPETEADSNDLVQAPKRLALQDSNISRYEKEFLEIARIGVGEFGYVYHCLNRLDGCDYAIKKSIKPVAGSIFEKTALNEVWAHAVLGKHDNVVRYYSAWAENNHMLIQNEYCNGGSLQNVLQSGRFLNESELRTLLMHIASGLKYIHSNDLVHMDLKAGNIFLSKIPANMPSNALRASTSSVEYCDDGFEDDVDVGDLVTYKIGDLGHVTSVNDPQVEEGDCRYLPNEILREDFTHLCKADIFALGITLYEAGGGGALPKNGAEWHLLRDGNVPDLPRLSREFNDLIKMMTHPDPQKRPSSTSIFYHPVLYTAESKTKAQLNHELNLQRQKNELLMKKLRESALLIKSYEQASTPIRKRGRISPTASDRKLRSYSSRKPVSTQRQRSMGRTKIPSANTYSDQNKNVVSDNIDFLL